MCVRTLGRVQNPSTRRHSYAMEARLRLLLASLAPMPLWWLWSRSHWLCAELDKSFVLLATEFRFCLQRFRYYGQRMETLNRVAWYWGSILLHIARGVSPSGGGHTHLLPSDCHESDWQHWRWQQKFNVGKKVCHTLTHAYELNDSIPYALHRVMPHLYADQRQQKTKQRKRGATLTTMRPSVR